MTDPTSPEKVSHRDKKSNLPTETFRRKITSGHKPKVGSTPRHID
jgi:hypothetical protein